MPSSTLCVCGDMQQAAEIGSDNVFVPHVNREGEPCPGLPLVQSDEMIATINDHFVGTTGGKIVVILPPRVPMETEEALRMAAWIVMCSYGLRDDAEERFAAILRAIKET